MRIIVSAYTYVAHGELIKKRLSALLIQTTYNCITIKNEYYEISKVILCFCLQSFHPMFLDVGCKRYLGMRWVGFPENDPLRHFQYFLLFLKRVEWKDLGVRKWLPLYPFVLSSQCFQSSSASFSILQWSFSTLALRKLGYKSKHCQRYIGP